MEYQVQCVQQANVETLLHGATHLMLDASALCPPNMPPDVTLSGRLLLEFSIAVPAPLMEVGKTYRVTIEEIPDE